MKILIIGSGGREHALAWKFSQDKKVKKIYVAPGNAGTESQKKCENINLISIQSLKDFAKDNNIEITIVGSEELLAKGIVDEFNKANLAIFGPHKKAAKLESSKAFAKQFMLKHGVKTAKYEEFNDINKAIKYLDNIDYPTVIKADGLAAGKGVIIAKNKNEAHSAIKEIMSDKIFGKAGDKIIIEEFLQGVEASILSFTDGKTILPLLSAKDHKKIGEGETGLNTGGMGAISPNPFVNSDNYEKFINNILSPTLKGINEDNLNFSGIIFFGLMINERGVFLIEYNMRMGDPETQTILPLLNNSLVELLEHGLNKELEKIKLNWKDKYATCIVAASKGYPQNYDKNKIITGTKNTDNKTICFIAGAKKANDKLTTSGGRVLNIVSIDNSVELATKRAYNNLKKVNFDGITYRKDIGKI